jgi:hypothetical protein
MPIYKELNMQNVNKPISGYGTDGRGVGARVEPQWGHDMSLIHVVQSASGAYSSFCAMSSGGCLPRG